MSLIIKEERLTVKAFATVPALLDLPEIEREPASVSNVSSRSSMGVNLNVNFEEGCIVTKSVKYTHQVTHLVNAVRSRDPEPVVSRNFRIVSYRKC
jgi:hypothetical protein